MERCSVKREEYNHPDDHTQIQDACLTTQIYLTAQLKSDSAFAMSEIRKWDGLTGFPHQEKRKRMDRAFDRSTKPLLLTSENKRATIKQAGCSSSTALSKRG